MESKAEKMLSFESGKDKRLIIDLIMKKTEYD